MPYGDGTGPRGRGSRTGRGLGNCPTQNNQNEGIDRGYGQGFGRGRGGGRGFRRR